MLVTVPAWRAAPLLAALLILLCVPAGASAAAPSCPQDDPDFGPGQTYGLGPRHVLAGVPERADAAGGIVVRDAGKPARTVTLARVPQAGAAAAGDRFGAALATGLLNEGDQCADMVVGAPGRGGAGAAYLLLGSTGALPSAATEIRAPDGAPGDRFGAAIALSGPQESGAHDLWIGAPGRDVAGRPDAGAIYHYVISQAGAVALADVVTQGAPLVPDAPEAGDRFGEVLAPIGSGVVAGLPHEDIGDRRDAGAIEQLRVSLTGERLPGRFLDQAAGGLERPEAGDRFGAAVAATGAGLAAGAPGEDVAGRRDAGLVAAYALRDDDAGVAKPLRPRRTYRQGAHGVPGRTEAGDRFGSALAGGAAFLCQEDSATAVGAPGEDTGRLHDAGAVTLIEGGDITSCHSRELIQGRGLAGRAHSGRRIGETLGTAPDLPGLDEDTYDTLLVGVPSGGILTLNSSYPRTRRRLAAPPGTPGYGSVFALPALG
jgi:hypothetical protein